MRRTATTTTPPKPKRRRTTLPVKPLGSVYSVQGGWVAGATSLVRIKNGRAECDCPQWTATHKACEHIVAVALAARVAPERSRRS